MTRKKTPIAVVEFGNILEYPHLYALLIAQTVAIYNSKLKSMEKALQHSRIPRIPKHPRTLLRESFTTVKNKQNYDQKFLLDSGVPSLVGLNRSVVMLAKDFGIVYDAKDQKKKINRSPLEKKSFQGPLIYGVAIDEYLDCRYEKIKEEAKTLKGMCLVPGRKRHQTGSKNHRCLEVRTLKKELKTLREAMDKVFACDTAYGDCNNNSMASGHCMLSSLLVQDLYGGDIKGGEVKGVPHYWNTFCHHDVDLTGDQFNKKPIQVKKGELYKGGYVFKRDPFESMNQDFNKQVWTKHCKFRKRVMQELRKIDEQLHSKLKKATARLT